MFRMQVWQWLVVGAAVVIFVGGMSVTVMRMFGRVADAPATIREATAFESAAVGAGVPTGAKAFDAFSYRVPARLAGRSRVMVVGDRVSVTGPRVPSGLYQSWIWIQALLLALAPVALIFAVVKLEWRWLLVALGVFVAGQLVSALGAGTWPGLGEMEYIAQGRFKAVEFPLSQVHDVKIGEGWADGGIDVVLLPVKGGIDAMSANRAVSFYAPDEHGRDVRYALHMTSEDDATELAGLLR
jgi:hypothetical protein